VNQTRIVIFILSIAMVLVADIGPSVFLVHNPRVIADQNVDWWPMLQHDLAHSGYSSSTAPHTNRTRWTYETGTAGVMSSAAVEDGKVYVGSYDKRVYALNATTGSQVWNYTTGGGVTSSPAISEGTVYVGSDDGNVYALNATNGARIWNYTTGGGESSPAVAGGRVYVGSWDNQTYCLDTSTGTLVWNYTTGSYVFSSPAVVNGTVYIGSQDHNVYALDAANGALRWSYTTSSWVYSSPAVVGGVVYIGSADQNVYALNATNGVRIWNYTIDDSIMCSPAFADGVIFVDSRCDTYALNATTGVPIWIFTTHATLYSSIAVADGVAFFGGGEGKLYALNASTGALIWSYQTGDQFRSTPAVADGSVYVGSDKVYAFGPAHDVAVTDVACSKTVVGQGYGLDITVITADLGSYPETFNVTVYANTSAIFSQIVTLSSGNSTDITFTWKATGLVYGNYTIIACALPVLSEANITNNNFKYGLVSVTIPGDVDGNGKVDSNDSMLLTNAFDSRPTSSNWNPNADINGDGVSNILDAIILANHFNQHYP
jgi:outer membrane protein assembly factor BamB